MLCLCGKSVLRVGHPPVLLDADPHPLGIYAQDGVKLSLRHIATAGSAHRAWRRHHCPAVLDDGPSLFQVVE